MGKEVDKKKFSSFKKCIDKFEISELDLYKNIIVQVKCELNEKDYKEKELIDLVKRTLSILESYGIIVRIKNDAFRFRV